MTRDEAIKKATDAWIVLDGSGCGGSIVNVLVSLGILKLDEPVSAMDRLWQSNSSCLMTRLDLKRALDAAGLKIVEK